MGHSVCENSDVVYGEEYNLADSQAVPRIQIRIRKKERDAVLTGPPWFRARSKSGGPRPLRDRDHLWGRPRLSREEKEHLTHHSQLLVSS